LIIKEHTISDQKNIILALGLLSMVIIALGLNGLRLNRLLKNLSQTDALSGLYNRRFMNKGLQDEIMKFKRYKTPFALLLLDIDYFKKINDTFGHDKGDLVIKKISSLMQKHIRSTDICARWGGEEFLILASNSDLSGAIKLANNLKELIENFDFEINHNVTVSIGVSSINESLEQESLLKLVDNALYKAKENGRNRVEIA
jgi:diguanylate cyclase (GGDEF)-like protein